MNEWESYTVGRSRLLVSVSLATMKTSATSPPSVVVLEVGDSARLNCRRSTQNEQWYFTGFKSQTPVVIAEDCRVLDEFNELYGVERSDLGCSLIIPNSSFYHAGKYTCEEKLSHTNPVTSEVTVLEIAPKCVDSNSGLSLYYGQDVTFQCAVTFKGNVMPSVKWTDSNGTTLINAKTVNVENSADSYLITQGFASDVGPFQCTVTATIASTTGYDPTIRNFTCFSKQLSVKVLEPVCYENSSAGEIVSGDYLNLTCSLTYIRGSLTPSLQWYDSNENPVINATIQSNDDQISSYILIPAYLPTIKPFTFVAYAPDSQACDYKSFWTSKEIEVSQCPQGFLYVSAVGSCYRVAFSSLTWDESRQKCSELYHDSYLSMIRSSTEQNAIATFLSLLLRVTTDGAGSCSTMSEAGYSVWIGGQTLNLRSCDPFVWKPAADATISISYTNWAAKGLPQCIAAYQHNCISLWSRQNYRWVDIPCNYAACALCQYGPW